MHRVDARGILSADNGMNPYRGCTHGCIYCDSRSACYGMEHDFEDVEVKRNAPELLELALGKKRRRAMISTGAMCDPYMPVEKTELITRRCLEIIDRHGFGFSVITKSDLVLRDLDLLKRVNARSKCVVQMTLTTYDEALCKILEPHVATTARRAEVLNTLRDAGIPTVVWLCPILPFINDTEENLRGVLDLCFKAGVRGIVSFGMGVTLRTGDREYFYAMLDRHFPGAKQRYIHAFGSAYICPSPNARALDEIFRRECSARGVMHDPREVLEYVRRFEDPRAGEQLSMF